MSAPVKVAVLGAGAGALSAAFALTRPALAGKYDVTVYQLGWRAGGKGASGRNAAECQRIEEHGLHIWMGFYDNAFSVMKEAYDELGRTHGPLQTLDEAFKPHSYIVLEEPFDGGWQRWQLDFPTNGQPPGIGPELSIWEMVSALIDWMRQRWSQSPYGQHAPVHGYPPPSFVNAVLAEAVASGPSPRPARARGALANTDLVSWSPPRLATHAPATYLASAHTIAASLAHDAKPTAAQAGGIVWLIQELMRVAWLALESRVTTDFQAFQLWVSMNLAGSAVCGILEDDVITKGWDSIDGHDLRAWLGLHGANQTTLAASPLRAVYDLVFGYVDGSVNKPAFAAGTAMRGMLRMLLGYKGAIFYKMQAGMGDTVFTPLYQVLVRRRVKFRFFHRIDDLVLDPTGKQIAAIELTEQVKLAGADYDPLVDVLDLPCWPSEPRYEQIASGAELAASGIDLESSWARPWKDARPKTLRLGTDFDQVVLGIGIGAFPTMAKQLIAASKPFAEMVTHVKTAQTCAFQLWLSRDDGGLGWQDPPPITELPVVGAFVEPLDTWADMSQLLSRETWPPGVVKSVQYFCGPFEQLGPLPPYTDHEFPRRQLGRLDAMALQFLRRDVSSLWPNTTRANDFDWSLLVAEQRCPAGPAKLLTQWLHVNIDPSERYVLSVPGSTAYRLPAAGSGFANVVLAGDWTQSNVNAGCVEAAVTSGLLAAQALAGDAPPIAWHGALRR